MRLICPNCEQESDVEVVRTVEDLEIRGEHIKVEVEYYKCLSCGEEFEDPRSSRDPLEKAYREYRKRHGMIQPEEIRSLRKKYGLTQGEMADLLGWGATTLSRYENGALQDEAHEKTLRLAIDPRNLLKLVEETPDALSEEKKNQIVEQLLAEEREVYSLQRIYEERFGRYGVDEFSGYRALDLSKLLNAILFFCKEGILKTVVNKLLFYADFRHFKENTVSITGSRYVKITFGPVPDGWQHYFTLLIEEGSLRMDEIFYDEEVTGEKFTSEKNPDLSMFSETELMTLAWVKKHFKNWTARRISDLSHNEKGYVDTPNGRFISYRYAEELTI
jgi:putative zinc finger/helix-turn-helix YgiT family protein